MNAFPFDQPAATMLYLLLCVVTFALHTVLAQGVVVGSLWIAFGHVREGRSAITDHTRDWMPALLSAAITAGVGPLLFVQILYKTEFYTANLLGMHRWMAVLPALILAFYLLYVTKARWTRSPRLARGAGACSALLFLFIAYSWSENHALSAAGRAVWSSQYESGRMVHLDPVIPVRLSVWGAMALACAPALIAWHAGARLDGDACRVLRRVSIGGLALLAVAVGVAIAVYGGRGVGAAPVWHWGVIALGAAVMGAGWARIDAGRKTLVLGSVLLALGVSVLREWLRFTEVGGSDLTAIHGEVLRAGGIAPVVVFGVFALLATGASVWAIRAVRTTD